MNDMIEMEADLTVGKKFINQTYKSIEIIIIDDASKDISKKILNKYKKNKKIKIIYNKKKNGLVKTQKLQKFDEFEGIFHGVEVHQDGELKRGDVIVKGGGVEIRDTPFSDFEKQSANE